MTKRLSKEPIERIEGCGISINTQVNLRDAIQDTLKSMLEEGWDYIDVKDYLFDLIDIIVDVHEAKNDKETIVRMTVVGRKVVIIDEIQTQNNVTIKTVSDFRLQDGIIYFEEDEYGTYFYSTAGAERFLEGTKAYLHANEVSIQLAN